jgi:predicted LPLAT superfamily acyltransferase
MATSPLSAGTAEGKTWLSARERGSVLGIQFFVWVSNILGRGPAFFFARFVALYYVLFYATARRASRDYLTRIHGHATTGMQYRHVLRFAEALIDRVFIVSGHDEYFDVTCTGHDHLVRLMEEKRGAILLGAHLGSFEAMRMQSGKESIRLQILGHFSNARMLNAALERINPKANAHVIAIDDKSHPFALRVRDCVRAGDLIGILGDRVGPDGRAARVRFLGGEAEFPTGAYMLAAILRCPIYLTFGLYRTPNRYDLYCEPFEEVVNLPRERRETALAEYAQRFATRLEHYVRMAPDNWFNFYDFWK